MSTHSGPNIGNEDGLVLSLDAANYKSVSDTSVWRNTVNQRGLSKSGSPTITTLGGATTFRFSASGQYFESTGLDADLTETATVECWIYPENEVTSGDRGTILRINGSSSLYVSWNKSNRKLSNYWYGHTPAGYHETGPAMDRNRWHHICSVWDGSTLHQYTNMNKTTTSVTGSSGTGTAVEIGMESSGRQFSGGIAVMKIYNRALSEEEVERNFNALRSRFGL